MRNAPAGDLAEHLVAVAVAVAVAAAAAAAAYEGTLAGASEKSWDVLLPSGAKIQVKCRVIAGIGPI